MTITPTRSRNPGLNMFTQFFIRHPVVTIVMTFIILLAGITAYFSLPISLYPKTNTAIISVYVSDSGADAELIENYITNTIENALSSVEGADDVTSESHEGYSYILLHLKMGSDVNEALNEANNKIASIRSSLPVDIDNPVVTKEDPSTRPILFLNFSSNFIKTEGIVDYLLRVVQPQLQTIAGIADDKIFGSGYAMRIWLNPYLMAAYDVTPSDLKNAFSANNLQSSGGQLENAWQLINVKTIADLNTAEQFNHMVIKQINGQFVRLNNIGKAVLEAKNKDLSIYTNGKRSVVVGIIPTFDANYLSVSHEIHQLFPRLEKNLPDGMNASLFWDSTKFIVASIKEVKKTIFEAILGVILIMFLCIGSWRILLIPSVTIPLSLLGICAAMYVMNYSLNTITFLAFVLSVGMVVDDSIVVSENIHRHIANGKDPVSAAMIGSREIMFAIISMTLTLAVVYLPIALMGGLIGALFKEFAFTLAGAVIISGFLSLTVSPMMCSKIMIPNILQNHWAQKTHQMSEQIMQYYSNLLSGFVEGSAWIFVLLPLAIMSSLFLYQHIPSELAPKEDVGYITMMVRGPTSANIAYTEKNTKLLEPIFKKIPEVENEVIVNGDGSNPSAAFCLLDLKPWSDRQRTSDEIIKTMFPQLMSMTDIIAQPINPSSLPGSDTWKGSVNVEIQTSGDYSELNYAVQKFLHIAESNSGLENLNTDLKLDQLQDDVIIDRNKAADLGISTEDISDAIHLALGKPRMSRFSRMGRNYDIIPQLESRFRNTVDAINALQVRTRAGTLVPLSNLITVREKTSPQILDHFQQMRSAEITASIAPGYTLGQALNYFQKISKTILPDHIQIDYSGESRLYLQGEHQMQRMFIFSFILIFLILSAQFESFRDALIIILVTPFSISGALLVMLMTGCTLNIYSEIGLITLIGLISKHGILMLEFANQLQRTGKNIRESIVTAASIRLRPILMTTAAVILGAVPLVFASGAGAVSRHQIGWVIIGGMLIGTIGTLFFIPAAYIFISREKTC